MNPSLSSLSQSTFEVAKKWNLEVYTENGTDFDLGDQLKVDNAIKKVCASWNVDVTESKRLLTCAILVHSYDYDGGDEPDTQFSKELWSHLQQSSTTDLTSAKGMIVDLFRTYQVRSVLVDIREASPVIDLILAGRVPARLLADAWIACKNARADASIACKNARADVGREHASRIRDVFQSASDGGV